MLNSEPRNILYIVLSVGILICSSMKLYNVWENIQTQKNIIQKRKDMDLFYEHEFMLTHLMRLEYPQTISASFFNDEIKELESKMIFDGYNNVDIGTIRRAGYRDAHEEWRENRAFEKNTNY